jgi:phenylpropionate dioxygenase-like ring-hydroxylating dioxygenase large terminal subunit
MDRLSDPAWARTFTDRAAFEHEQAQLGSLWTLLGLTTDIPKDGDWFRATLGGRSVFVQRFGDSLRGFENVCSHRFYPLRTKDKGNGPIRCGFHHWQYNKDGLAVGIPKCQEMFGVTPRELNARLTPIEIATCGILVFGRFKSERHIETLEQSFGDAFPILQAMWRLKRAPYYIETDIAANWRLVYHITLDDYHIVAVHPDTFGKDGYLPVEEVRYHRLGRHSAYFYAGGDDEVKKMADQCVRGAYRPAGYRIFQFFPNLLALHIDAAMNWYVLIQQYVPVAPDRCISRSWFFPAPFPPEDRTWTHSLLRRVLAPFVPFVLPFYIRKIFNEDNSVCERIQTVAHQIDGFPILGRHEQRIAWFESVYAEAVGDRLASKAAIKTLVHDREARTGEQPKTEPRRQQAQ